MRNETAIGVHDAVDPVEGIAVAFELLLDEFRTVLTDVYRLREKVQAQLTDSALPNRVISITPHRRSFGRTPQGIKTSVDNFYQPILQALVTGGGELPKTRVLASVESSMQGILNREDLGRNRSNGIPRWHSTADHARQKMVIQGYLEAGTRKGIWKITEEGRNWLGQAA